MSCATASTPHTAATGTLAYPAPQPALAEGSLPPGACHPQSLGCSRSGRQPHFLGACPSRARSDGGQGFITVAHDHGLLEPTCALACQDHWSDDLLSSRSASVVGPEQMRPKGQRSVRGTGETAGPQGSS